MTTATLPVSFLYSCSCLFCLLVRWFVGLVLKGQRPGFLGGAGVDGCSRPPRPWTFSVASAGKTRCGYNVCHASASASFNASFKICSGTFNASRDSARMACLARLNLRQNFFAAISAQALPKAPPARHCLSFHLLVSFSYSPFFYVYVTITITQSHKKRDRQLVFFLPQTPEAFTASITSARVVFSRSRSIALWAEVKTLAQVSRMQWPTGQAALGFSRRRGKRFRVLDRPINLRQD